MPPNANPNQPSLDIESIGAPEIVPETPDKQTAAELESYTREARLLRLKDFGQTITQRKLYAKLIFGLACVWLMCILCLAFLQGIHWPRNFTLSDSVLIALIATTTANIIGVLIVVTKYLFPGR